MALIIGNVADFERDGLVPGIAHAFDTDQRAGRGETEASCDFMFAIHDA